jgi:hypothetical protein
MTCFIYYIIRVFYYILYTLFNLITIEFWDMIWKKDKFPCETMPLSQNSNTTGVTNGEWTDICINYAMKIPSTCIQTCISIYQWIFMTRIWYILCKLISLYESPMSFTGWTVTKQIMMNKTLYRKHIRNHRPVDSLIMLYRVRLHLCGSLTSINSVANINKRSSCC